MPPEGSTSILDSIPPQVLEMILQSLSRQQQPQPPADVGLPKSRFMRTVGEFGQFAKLPPVDRLQQQQPIPQVLRPPVSDDTNLLNFLR